MPAARYRWYKISLCDWKIPPFHTISTRMFLFQKEGAVLADHRVIKILSAGLWYYLMHLMRFYGMHFPWYVSLMHRSHGTDGRWRSGLSVVPPSAVSWIGRAWPRRETRNPQEVPRRPRLIRWRSVGICSLVSSMDRANCSWLCCTWLFHQVDSVGCFTRV